MYQYELKQSGESLFKVRGHFLTLVVVIGAVVAWRMDSTGPFRSDTANEVWFGISLAVALAGAFIRAITNGYAAPGTSGNSKDAPVAAELNTSGPYSLVRNPLYVGRILNFTGIAMLSGHWMYGALVLLLSVLVYERIAVFEEEFLRAEFGETHARWAAEVPFLLPRWHGWVKPRYPFRWRRCLRREIKKIFWFATALMLFDFARVEFDLGQVSENPFWYYTWAMAALATLIIGGLSLFTKSFERI